MIYLCFQMGHVKHWFTYVFKWDMWNTDLPMFSNGTCETLVLCNTRSEEVQYNLNGSNPDGSFTVDDSNSFSVLQNPSNSARKQILGNFFLIWSWNSMLCVLIRIASWGDSNEYTQHTIIVFKVEKISLRYRCLLPKLTPWLTLSGSNYPCLEQFSIVPKMFEPLRFDCI